MYKYHNDIQLSKSSPVLVKNKSILCGKSLTKPSFSQEEEERVNMRRPRKVHGSRG